MKYLLDTNICIHWLRAKYSIAERIQERGLDNCCISEITKAELLLGEELALKKGYNVPQVHIPEHVRSAGDVEIVHL